MQPSIRVLLECDRFSCAVVGVVLQFEQKECLESLSLCGIDKSIIVNKIGEGVIVPMIGISVVGGIDELF